MKPIPLQRHAQTIAGSLMNVSYKGCVIRATRSGRLEVLASDGEPVGNRPTLGAAKALVDRQFVTTGPEAA